YINISGYQFVKLPDPESIKVAISDFCNTNALKGTVLIGHEGINAFLSAHREMIDAFYQFLPTLGFNIEFKESTSLAPPFKHMRVKVKAEIVTMGVPDLDVVKKTAPRVSVDTFKQWLDEGKEIIILDTRNDYEVSLGKFEKAIDLNIKNFRAFPQAVKKLGALKDKTIVTYCTGGIRCEKAAPYLVSQGFTDVYQLDGGILKYLEKHHHDHYEGECFVFDKRLAVDENLNETNTVQCHGCRHPVSEQDQQSQYYVEGTSCPQCYV
ncbi:MAG: rhodanese-related sulfurtransferase, partial [Candidatus Berkiella sp.]